ncbi:MAG TPA: hypothetical protein VGD29_05695, partial [Actinoplanes sp.]
MPALTLPSLSAQASFLAAVDEMRAEGQLDPTGPIARAVATYGSSWQDPAEFQRFLDDLRAQEREETPRPENFVPTSYLWWIDGVSVPARPSIFPERPSVFPERPSVFLGRPSIRHRLARGQIGLRNGHIGYEVRPS